ncbi:hypothetical protein [Anaerofustis butyriciformans]|uniref:hypothetical protein n=1 Tax=Anaerofustis butyriciformans TaxID=3108533 RepID=UPI002E37FD40|nr:hypothetical protein [Anaerofustis sp. HA2171]
MAAEITVDIPILKGEKGDKGDTGSFDYTHLEEIVDEHLNNRFEDVNANLELKVDKEVGKSLVDDEYIEKLNNLETLDKTVIEKFNDKVEQKDFEDNLVQMESQLQNYIDGKLVTSGSGDMLKRIYDTDGDGIVDKAENANNADKVNNLTVETAVPPDAVFTDTTYETVTTETDGLMSFYDKVKLNGIQSGANYVEVVDNLESDMSDKALSSVQGKVLNENINVLESKVKNLEDIKRVQLFKGSISKGIINLSDNVTNYRFLMIGFNKAESIIPYASWAVVPVLYKITGYQSFTSFLKSGDEETRSITSYLGTIAYISENQLEVKDEITNLYHIGNAGHSGTFVYEIKEIWGIK